MPGCPQCRRPIAVSRLSCLYCGAPLSPEAVGATLRAAEPAKEAPQTGDRLLLIVDLGSVGVEVAARVLNASVFDVQQWARRGCFHLRRIAPAASARAEAEGMTREGLSAHLLSEAEVRAAATPLLAGAGSVEGESLRLRLGDGELRLTAADLLLVVRGPIRREHAGPRPQVRWGVFQVGGWFGLPGLEFGAATLGPGDRFHLHRRRDPRPLELDPGAFQFSADPGLADSSEQRLTAWLAELASGVPVDDSFKRQTPALAPAEPAGGPLSAVEALARPPLGPQGPASQILDNLAQFRFYSAWRGLLERQRAGLTAPAGPVLPSGPDS